MNGIPITFRLTSASKGTSSFADREGVIIAMGPNVDGFQLLIMLPDGALMTIPADCARVKVSSIARIS